MFGDKEYDLVSEKCSPLVAKLALWAIVSGGIATGLIAVGTLVALTSTKIVSPIIEWVKHRQLPAIPGPSIVSVGISLALTIVLIALASYVALRWLKSWQRFLVVTLSDYMKRLSDRIKHLEENAADLKTANEAVTSLMHRVARLEPPPLDVPGSLGSIGGLAKAALVRRLQESASINNVGKLPGPFDDNDEPASGDSSSQ